MNVKTYLCIVGICFSILSIPISTAYSQQAANTNDSMKIYINELQSVARGIEVNSLLTYELFLQMAGAQTGCYFTLEYSSPRERKRRLDVNVKNYDNVTSVESLVSRIRRDLPGFEVQPNERNSNIFHIIERECAKEDEYPLNLKTSLEFTGTPNGWSSVEKGVVVTNEVGLMSTLALKVKGLRLSSVFPGSQGTLYLDTKSRISVHATNETVRNIITDCLPLEGYSPVLWRAITLKGETWIGFSGPIASGKR